MIFAFPEEVLNSFPGTRLQRYGHGRSRAERDHGQEATMRQPPAGSTKPRGPLDQATALVRLDFSPKHRQPTTIRVVMATIASIAGSLLADAILVVLGVAVFPSTKGYVHFQFNDYSKLTVIGVLIACVAWPIVTRISSAPRWLFFRLAILVTLFLLLPDFYILYRGQPTDAVSVLMVMHLAIAVVTYNALVHLAPTHPAAPDR
jgi:hypothetical protein